MDWNEIKELEEGFVEREEIQMIQHEKKEGKWISTYWIKGDNGHLITTKELRGTGTTQRQSVLSGISGRMRT